MISLSEFKNESVSFKSNEAYKGFLWSMIIDRGLLKNNHKLFYTDADMQVYDVFRVLDESYFRKFKPLETRKINFKYDKGMIKEFFDNKAFDLELPICREGKDITDNFIQHWLGPMAKERMIDDILFNIVKTICLTLGVYYDHKSWVIWFGTTNKKPSVYTGGQRTTVEISEIRLEDVLLAEVRQWYVNCKIGDPDREYAYSHLLRANGNFKLFNWAKKVIINWTKYNIIAASRTQGKTFLAAEIAARELLKEWTGFGWRLYREIKYFVPDKSNIGDQAMTYIESLLGDLINKKVDGKVAFEINRAKQVIKCNITGNIFKIVSLYNVDRGDAELGNATGEGIACDFAIIDEAARIPDNFWISFHQRAAFETDTFVVISTINKETPVDHWFYKLLIDGELGNPMITSYRLTVDDNEAMRQGKTEEQFLIQLEAVKTALRAGWDREFYAKGYCMILEESNIFNTGSYLAPPASSTIDYSDPRILGFDLGKLTDTCGLVMINLRMRKIEIADKVLNASYGTQLQYAKDFKDKYKNLLVIWDRTGVGEAVSEQDIHGVVDTWIKSTGAWELSFNKQFGFYTCNKGKIINTLATVLNSNILKISSDLGDLIDQLNNFIKMKSARGEIILYKGKGKKKDDLVLSLAYAVIYMYLILWLKSVEDIEAYVNETCEMQTYQYNDTEQVSSNYHNWLY